MQTTTQTVEKKVFVAEDGFQHEDRDVCFMHDVQNRFPIVDLDELREIDSGLADFVWHISYVDELNGKPTTFIIGRANVCAFIEFSRQQFGESLKLVEEYALYEDGNSSYDEVPVLVCLNALNAHSEVNMFIVDIEQLKNRDLEGFKDSMERGYSRAVASMNSYCDYLNPKKEEPRKETWNKYTFTLKREVRKIVSYTYRGDVSVYGETYADAEEALEDEIDKGNIYIDGMGELVVDSSKTCGDINETEMFEYEGNEDEDSEIDDEEYDTDDVIIDDSMHCGTIELEFKEE